MNGLSRLVSKPCYLLTNLHIDRDAIQKHRQRHQKGEVESRETNCDC